MTQCVKQRWRGGGARFSAQNASPVDEHTRHQRPDSRQVCQQQQTGHGAGACTGGALLGDGISRAVPLEGSKGEVLLHLLVCDLGVIDAELGTLLHEALAHVNGRRLARVPCTALRLTVRSGAPPKAVLATNVHACKRGVRGTGVRTGVLLERKAQQCDVLVTDRVEHAGNHALDEAVLLVVVHIHHLRTPPSVTIPPAAAPASTQRRIIDASTLLPLGPLPAVTDPGWGAGAAWPGFTPVRHGSGQ